MGCTTISRLQRAACRPLKSLRHSMLRAPSPPATRPASHTHPNAPPLHLSSSRPLDSASDPLPLPSPLGSALSSHLMAISDTSSSRLVGVPCSPFRDCVSPPRHLTQMTSPGRQFLPVARFRILPLMPYPTQLSHAATCLQISRALSETVNGSSSGLLSEPKL